MSAGQQRRNRELLGQKESLEYKINQLEERVRVLDSIKNLLEAICGEFERTIAHADWLESGSKGMSVPFHGDFSQLVRFPSVINKFRWWAREFRSRLDKLEKE